MAWLPRQRQYYRCRSHLAWYCLSPREKALARQSVQIVVMRIRGMV
jgi:hypothetical protein